MSLQSSSFRRSGQRDDRRRRLLTDELANSGDWPACRVRPDDAPPPQKSEHYGQAEFLDEQLRLLDLIPRRVIVLAPLLVAGAAIIAGLEFAYAWMLDRVAGGAAVVAALDLAAKGSLGCWFASLLLLTASAMALLVYSVRRYRTDDYQGCYRIWLWAAVCWFLMATDQAASLREGFCSLMVVLTGTSLMGDGSLWWVIVYALILGAVGSRLLIDMRSHPFSMALLLAAALAHVLVVAGRLGWITLPGGSREIMFRAGTELTGNLLLLTAMILYARYVLFDAEGLLPRCELEPDEELDEETDDLGSKTSVGSRWTKVDPPHPTPQPVFQRPVTAASVAPAPVFSPTSTATASPVNRKLTKQERKVLKERLLRERRERERRDL